MEEKEREREREREKKNEVSKKREFVSMNSNGVTHYIDLAYLVHGARIT